MVQAFEAHILLVEDTVSIAEVFATQLQNAGFSVDTVHLGEQAREQLAAFRGLKGELDPGELLQTDLWRRAFGDAGVYTRSA